MSSINPRISAPLPKRLQAGPRASLSLGLHARVFLHQADLDAALAAGADPGESPELALRARRLAGSRHRAALAEGLERAVRHAERGEAPRIGCTPLARRSMRACRPALLNLAQDLRAAEDARPAGLARAHVLLTDGLSPLYLGGDSGELSDAVRAAEMAL